MFTRFKFFTPTKTEYASESGSVYFQDLQKKSCTCMWGTHNVDAIFSGEKKCCRHLQEIIDWLKEHGFGDSLLVISTDPRPTPNTENVLAKLENLEAEQ